MIAVILIIIGIVIIFTSGIADLYFMFIITGLVMLVVATIWEVINDCEKKKARFKK